MALPDVREQLIAKLNDLSDEQVSRLLSYARGMESETLPEDYSEEDDPSIGFISGPTDLARRAKQILRDEITYRSGWTQKKD